MSQAEVTLEKLLGACEYHGEPVSAKTIIWWVDDGDSKAEMIENLRRTHYNVNSQALYDTLSSLFEEYDRKRVNQ